MDSRRLLAVATDSSAARMPLPGATMAWAISLRSLALMSLPFLVVSCSWPDDTSRRSGADSGIDSVGQLEAIPVARARRSDEVGEEEAGGRGELITGPGHHVPGPVAGEGGGTGPQLLPSAGL